MSNTPPEPHAYERRSKENMERHIQTIMIALIIGALTFAANYFYNDNREKGEDRAQISVLTNQVIELRADVRAMQSGFARKDEFEKLDGRMRDLELRIREVERKIR